MLTKVLRFFLLPCALLLISCGSLAAQITEYQKVVVQAKKQVRGDQGLVVSMSPEVILAIRGKPFTATCVYVPHKVLQAGKIVETSPLRAKIARDSVGRIYKEEVGFLEDQGYSSVRGVRIYDPVKEVSYFLNPGEQEVTFHQYRMQLRPVSNKNGSPPLPPRIAFRGKPSVDLGIEEIEGFTAYGEMVERSAFVISKSYPVEISEWFSPELAMVLKIVWKQQGSPVRTMEVTDISVGEPDPALFELPPGSTLRGDSPDAAEVNTGIPK